MSFLPRPAKRLAVRDSYRPAAPPWTLFWLVSWLVAVPGQLAGWKVSLFDLVGVTPVHEDVGPGSGVLRLTEVVDLAHPVLLAAALATLFAAPVRGRLMRRRFGLTGSGPPAVAEIAGFVRAVAPGVAVQSNMRRLDVRAFVCPLGYRRTALGVGGALVKLWRGDREAAEAVIRHELWHREQGDSLMLGPVSSLEAVLRRWWWILIAFVVVPVGVAWVAETTDFFRQIGTVGAEHKASQFVTLIMPTLLWMLLTSTAELLAAITLPIAASWSAELAADHQAATRGSRDALGRALQSSRSLSGGWRGWLLRRITHPPLALRQALARAGTTAQLAAAISVYPVAWLIQLLWIMIGAASAYAGAGYGFGTIISGERSGLAIWAHSGWPVWMAGLALVSVWPLAGDLWRSAVVMGRTAA